MTEADYGSCLELETTAKPEIAIVDLGDTESQGLKLCAQLRADSEVPIVILGIDDRWFVPALSVGADEYLGRPLDLPKLLAVLMALMRRCGAAAKSRRVIQIRALSIDLDRCRVLVKNKPVHLTPVEYRLLASLSRREGRVASCSELVKEVQGYEMDEEEARDIMKVHIYHLRHKLRAYGAEEDYIVTVPGFGYVLERRATQRTGTAAQGWLRRGTFIRPSAEEAV
ncbi:MAG: response regulator transcription factor [Chloroflexota bacterium]